MLRLILLIAASAILIAGAAFAMVNDLSPAELAKEAARLFQRFTRPQARLRRIRGG